MNLSKKKLLWQVVAGVKYSDYVFTKRRDWFLEASLVHQIVSSTLGKLLGLEERCLMLENNWERKGVKAQKTDPTFWCMY